MIRWIGNVRSDERISSDSVLKKLEITSLVTLMRYSKKIVSRYGHYERSDSWIERCTEVKVEGSQGRGTPRKTWAETGMI